MANANVDNTGKLSCLSLCTGYGGFELACRRVFGERVRTVVYVEIEAFAVANLVAKMEAGRLDIAPIWSDIKTFPAKSFRDRIHIITAGYPCQPFSTAGKRKGRKDPRHLWPFIRRIIEEVRPVWFIGENVAGHLKNGFPFVATDLAGLGYSVEAGLFTAAEVGAPHLRKRLFFMAYDPGRGLEIGEGEQTGESALECGCTKLAHAGGQKPRGISNSKQEENIAIRATGEMADPECAGAGLRDSGIEGEEAGLGRGGSSNGCWPAGPGQRQYEWEEPRTICKSDRGTGDAGRAGGTNEGIKQGHKGPAEPGLGRAVDGS